MGAQALRSPPMHVHPADERVLPKGEASVAASL